MKEEVSNILVETGTVSGEESKRRGLNWAVISLGLIILTMIIGTFLAAIFMPNPQKLDTPSNTTSAPIQH